MVRRSASPSWWSAEQVGLPGRPLPSDCAGFECSKPVIVARTSKHVSNELSVGAEA